jgi:hypothetical protein
MSRQALTASIQFSLWWGPIRAASRSLQRRRQYRRGVELHVPTAPLAPSAILHFKVDAPAKPETVSGLETYPMDDDRWPASESA